MTLGFRALVVYIIKGLLPGVILLLVAFGLLLGKNSLITLFLGSGYTGADSVNKIVLFVIGGLYIASMLALAIGLLVNLIRYFTCHFTIDDYAFKYHRGLISRDEVSIPFHQIQDVDVDQSVIGRIFGIGKLIIVTAGNEDEKKDGEESDIVFEIIDISVAKYLQKTLTEKSSVQLVRNAPAN